MLFGTIVAVLAGRSTAGPVDVRREIATGLWVFFTVSVVALLGTIGWTYVH